MVPDDNPTPPPPSRQERLDRMVEEFRAAKQRQLLKQETARLNRTVALEPLPEPTAEKLN